MLIGDERRSFVWRDGVMTVHRGGKGLHLTHSISDVEQVIGATYSRKLEPATMRSTAVPVVDNGGTKFLISVFVTLAAAGALVLYRRRYRGMDINNVALI